MYEHCESYPLTEVVERVQKICSQVWLQLHYWNITQLEVYVYIYLRKLQIILIKHYSEHWLVWCLKVHYLILGKNF